MKIYTNGTASIAHSQTQEVYEIENDILQWEPVSGEERGMGESTTYEAVVEHEQLGELTWTLVEYPVGAQNMTSTDSNGHKIIKDFDYGLEHTPED